VGDVLAEFPGVTWDEVRGIRRTKRLIKPRQECMYEVSTQRPDLSFPAIGRIFGGRDHTTIMHSVRKVSANRAAA
jgi:chromosomal replication initiator protein